MHYRFPLFIFCILILPHSILSAKCDGIIIKDNSNIEATIPFGKQEASASYTGLVGYFVVVDKEGNPISDFNEEKLREKLINYSKARCVPRTITYPDIRLYLKVYKEGRLSSVQVFVNNGKIENLIYLYDPPGNIWSIAPVKNGNIHGKAQYYHLDESLNYTQEFRNGLKHGCFEEHYENGKIKAKGCYVTGKLNGKIIRFFDDGNIELDASFNHGLIIGTYKVNYNSGNPKIRAFYKNGVPEGLYTQYYPNGTLKERTSFLDGKILGKANIYFEDSSIAEEYISGSKDKPGYYKTYYKGGGINITVPVVANKYEDVYKEYSEDGKLLGRCFYKSGLIDGECKTFYENGSVESVAKYRKGTQISYESFYDYGGKKLIKHFTQQNVFVRIDTYNPFGILDTVYPIKNGIIDGVVRKHYRNGNVASTTKYIQNIPQNPITGFYPNGNKQYEVNIDNDGHISDGVFYDESGVKKKYIKTPKDEDNVILEAEYYDGEKIKSLFVVKPEGKESRFYYGYGDSNKPVIEQTFEKSIGLEYISMNSSKGSLLCFWDKKSSDYICGNRDNYTKKVEILDRDIVLKVISEFSESNGFVKEDIDNLIDTQSPLSLFSKYDLALATPDRATSKLGEKCYNIGFMFYCE